MITTRKIAALVTGAAAVVTMTAATAGAAEPTTGREFASHVRMMAQSDMGFDGTRNPGMHQGFSGMEAHHSS